MQSQLQSQSNIIINNPIQKMKTKILSLLVLSLCVLSVRGAIMKVLKGKGWPRDFLRVPIFTRVPWFQPTVDNLMCSLGDGHSLFGDLNSRIELRLNADPAVMKADCVGVINLTGDDRINNKKIAVYMLFSPGSVNVLKYSLNQVSNLLSVDQLFGKDVGPVLQSTQNSTPTDIIFQTADGEYYRFQANFRKYLVNVKLQVYEEYSFEITIDPLGSFI